MVERIKRFAVKNKLCQYIVNILFLVYGFLLSVLYLIMRIFPVQDKKVVCCNMKGKRYGDNPKYITDALLKKDEKYDVVWILEKNIKEDLPANVRRVPNNLLSVTYELATSQIWIDSNTKQYGTLKRKPQLYIQTWHGSYGLKKVYGDIIDKITFIDKITLKYNSKITDLYISNSKRTSEIYRRAFWYSGNILECGSPRNDIFFKDTKPYLENVQKYFGIQDKKMALYAPTFRADFGLEALRLNYENLKKALERRFYGEWVILVRLHPNNISDAETFIKYNNSVINATPYNNMQELLAVCDVLITDYSSCMFDFATKNKICFLYATDVEKYRQERDYYFELEDLPFPLAQNNRELEEVILRFDELQYQRDLQKLFTEVGICESGEASTCVVDYIEHWRKDK